MFFQLFQNVRHPSQAAAAMKAPDLVSFEGLLKKCESILPDIRTMPIKFPASLCLSKNILKAYINFITELQIEIQNSLKKEAILHAMMEKHQVQEKLEQALRSNTTILAEVSATKARLKELNDQVEIAQSVLETETETIKASYKLSDLLETENRYKAQLTEVKANIERILHPETFLPSDDFCRRSTDLRIIIIYPELGPDVIGRNRLRRQSGIFKMKGCYRSFIYEVRDYKDFESTYALIQDCARSEKANDTIVLLYTNSALHFKVFHEALQKALPVDGENLPFAGVGILTAKAPSKAIPLERNTEVLEMTKQYSDFWFIDDSSVTEGDLHVYMASITDLKWLRLLAREYSLNLDTITSERITVELSLREELERVSRKHEESTTTLLATLAEVEVELARQVNELDTSSAEITKGFARVAELEETILSHQDDTSPDYADTLITDVLSASPLGQDIKTIEREIRELCTLRPRLKDAQEMLAAHYQMYILANPIYSPKDTYVLHKPQIMRELTGLECTPEITNDDL